MKNDYLEDLKEWQDHQYVKGYYTGDRMPPFVKYGNRPGGSQRRHMVRILLAVVWIPMLVACVVMMVRHASGNIAACVGIGLLVSLTGLLLFFSYGVPPVKKKSRRRKRR